MPAGMSDPPSGGTYAGKFEPPPRLIERNIQALETLKVEELDTSVLVTLIAIHGATNAMADMIPMLKIGREEKNFQRVTAKMLELDEELNRRVPVKKKAKKASS